MQFRDYCARCSQRPVIFYAARNIKEDKRRRKMKKWLNHRLFSGRRKVLEEARASAAAAATALKR